MSDKLNEIQNSQILVVRTNLQPNQLVINLREQHKWHLKCL